MRRTSKFLWILLFALVVGSVTGKTGLAAGNTVQEAADGASAGEAAPETTPEVSNGETENASQENSGDVTGEQQTPAPEGKEISLGTQGETNIILDYNESGRFVLDTGNETSVFAPVRDKIDHILFEYSQEKQDSDMILDLSEDGQYHTTGLGDAAITVRVYDAAGTECMAQTFNICVTYDMNPVSLSKKSFFGKTVIFGEDYNTFTADVLGMEGMGDDICGLTLKKEITNEDMDADVFLEDGKLCIDVYGIGKTKIYVWINEKKFTITVNIKQIKISGKTAFYLLKGQKKQLKITNLGKKEVTFKSLNPEVASVTKDGLIQGKKVGNAVILATVDGQNFGCALSVLTKTRKKLVTKAKYIGTNLTYSQPRRMQKKYYDCSSLVWKCYKLENQYFGDRYYAPVAAAIAKYCVLHKKIVTGNIAQNIQKMKYLPGALTFKPGARNGRYRGIYHVEMFVGYTFEGVEEDGTPILGTRWGARDDNYEYGSIWAQP